VQHEGSHAVAQRVDRRLVAGVQQHDGGADDLVLGQVLAGLLHGDQL
jgi:hypothetical protein